jgi:hypothetical protein
VGVSIREAARQLTARGFPISERGIRKARAEGRVTLEPDGTVDLEKLLAQWVGNSDPRRSKIAAQAGPQIGQARTTAPSPRQPRPQPTQARPGGDTAVAEPEPGEGAPSPGKGPPSRADALTLAAVWDAKLKEQKFMMEAGGLLRAGQVSQTWFSIVRAARDRLLALPERIVEQHVADPALARQLVVKFTEEIETLLRQMADDTRALKSVRTPQAPAR